MYTIDDPGDEALQKLNNNKVYKLIVSLLKLSLLMFSVVFNDNMFMFPYFILLTAPRLLLFIFRNLTTTLYCWSYRNNFFFNNRNKDKSCKTKSNLVSSAVLLADKRMLVNYRTLFVHSSKLCCCLKLEILPNQSVSKVICNCIWFRSVNKQYSVTYEHICY